MPNRILKEKVCTSDSIEQLTWFEEVLFYRLIVNCDDYGRLDARTAILKSKLFPLKERLAHKDIENALQKLSDVGCVRLYNCDNKPYLCLTTWEDHQSIRAKKSKYPDPLESDIQEDASSCKQMISDDCICPRNPIQSESNPNPNPNPKESSRALRFTPPTAEEVSAYCLERKNKVDPQRFVDYYTARGWLIGKSKMKDWQAAVRTWENNDKEKNDAGENKSADCWGNLSGITKLG